MVVLPVPSNRSINKRKCSSLSHGYGIMITSRSKHGASTMYKVGSRAEKYHAVFSGALIL